MATAFAPPDGELQPIGAAGNGSAVTAREASETGWRDGETYFNPFPNLNLVHPEYVCSSVASGAADPAKGRMS